MYSLGPSLHSHGPTPPSQGEMLGINSKILNPRGECGVFSFLGCFLANYHFKAWDLLLQLVGVGSTDGKNSPTVSFYF